jgi:Site-specific recombinases, DNA invertase Pin homologs
MNKYGYCRVSAKDQNLDRQVVEMTKRKIKSSNIFYDKISGVNFERPSYKKMIKKLGKGDVLFIKSIDRLGRNYNEVIGQWNYIVKEKKADIVVIDMSLLDTRKAKKTLLTTFICDLVLLIFCYVAESEFNSIRQRQKEGIEIAKLKQIQFGRKKLLSIKEFSKLYDKYKLKGLSNKEISRCINISLPTFYRYLKMRKDEKIINNM